MKEKKLPKYEIPIELEFVPSRFILKKHKALSSLIHVNEIFQNSRVGMSAP